jgi:hypothetical protein
MIAVVGAEPLLSPRPAKVLFIESLPSFVMRLMSRRQ